MATLGVKPEISAAGKCAVHRTPPESRLRLRVDRNDRQLNGTLQEITQIVLDEAFVLPIVELTCKASAAEVARAAVKNVAWNDLGWYVYEDIWLAR